MRQVMLSVSSEAIEGCVLELRASLPGALYCYLLHHHFHLRLACSSTKLDMIAAESCIQGEVTVLVL